MPGNPLKTLDLSSTRQGQTSLVLIENYKLPGLHLQRACLSSKVDHELGTNRAIEFEKIFL